MSMADRLITGAPFPNITLPTTDGAKITLGAQGWRALFVIRGAHCQICRAYLAQLERKRPSWEIKGIEVVVASADPVEKSQEFMREAGYGGLAACNLDVPAMQALGLWLTGPEVSDLAYVHPEPGFFLIDPDGNIAAAEASTLPTARPDLELLDQGFKYIIENNVRPPFGRYETSRMTTPMKRKGETVLLTGATGYVGSVIAEKLRAAGYAVRGLTRSESKVPALKAKGIKPIVGNVNDPNLMSKAVNGVDAIIHTASPAAPSPGKSLEQIVTDAVSAIELLADLANKNNVRLIVTSGVSLYGPTNGEIVDETAPSRTPPFAKPLAKAETTLAKSGGAHIIRLAVVYGRDQSLPMRALINSVKQQGAPVIVEPANRLSVAHVDDLADLYIELLEAKVPPAIINGVGSIITWSEVMNAIARAANVLGDPKTITPDEAAKLGGPAIYMAMDMAVSGARARIRLGWQPKGPDFNTDLTQ